MNKEQYLQKLRESLSGLSAEETAEIMQYYTEYFEDAGPEHETAVIEELGDPSTLASQAASALGQAPADALSAARYQLPALFGLLKGHRAGREDQPDYRFREMDLEPFHSVFIRVRNCPITVEESNDGRYGADICLLLSEGETAHTGIVEGVFTVRINGRPLTRRNQQGSQYVKLYLPAAEYERIELRSSNASIQSCCPAVIRGELKIDTSNSSVKVRGVRNAEKISADSSNGSIHFRSLRCGELLADTSNGSIRVEDVSCRVCAADTSNASIVLKDSSFRSGKADTSNGSISVSGCIFTDRLYADTSNASISAELAGSEADYRVKADTSNAAVYVNGEKRGRSYKTGSGKHEVILDTSNGRISINYLPQALPDNADKLPAES